MGINISYVYDAYTLLKSEKFSEKVVQYINMDNSLLPIYNRIITEHIEDAQKTFINEYCSELVRLKESGILSEEEVGHRIVCILFTDPLHASYEFEDIFDAATALKIPRESSYVLGMGKWNQKDADCIKQKEYSELLKEIDRVKKSRNDS